MNIYYLHAEDANGENLDLFVSASEPAQAQSLFAAWCRQQEWELEREPRLFAVNGSTSARVLRWHEDIQETKP